MPETQMSKKRAALWVVGTIIGPLAFFWFTSGWYIGMWYARTGHKGPPTSEIMIQGMFIGLPPALWAAVLVWWWMHRKKTAFAELYSTRTSTAGMDISMGVVFGALWVAVYGLFDVVSWRDMFTFNAAKLASVPASLSAGFCEEALYRGFLFWVIAAAGGRKASQLTLGSIAFGLAHCFWGPWGMLWTTILGITFGLAVLWRGNVWPAVVAHTLLDLCIEPGLIQKALTDGFTP
jgi:membrane protease YdiL (CAAX protease family)